MIFWLITQASEITFVVCFPAMQIIVFIFCCCICYKLHAHQFRSPNSVILCTYRNHWKNFRYGLKALPHLYLKTIFVCPQALNLMQPLSAVLSPNQNFQVNNHNSENCKDLSLCRSFISSYSNSGYYTFLRRLSELFISQIGIKFQMILKPVIYIQDQ